MDKNQQSTAAAGIESGLITSASSQSTIIQMAPKIVTIHSSLLFDPKKKAFVDNVSIRVDSQRGSIVEVYTRESDDEIHDRDIDLRGKVVMPGFVDAHTHVFLHPYRYVYHIIIYPLVFREGERGVGNDIGLDI